jgi:hypothetical protein
MKCACGCGEVLTPSRWTKNPRYRRFHFEASPEGKAAASKGGKKAQATRRIRRAA